MDKNLNQQNIGGQQTPQMPQAPNPIGASIPQAPPPPLPPQTPVGNPPPPFQPPPVQAPPPPPGRPATGSSMGSNKTVLFGGLGVIALAIIGGIYFLAVQYSQKTAQVPEITPIPRISLSPTPPLVEATEADIDNIDLGDPENDLKGLDQDVKQL